MGASYSVCVMRDKDSGRGCDFGCDGGRALEPADFSPRRPISRYTPRARDLRAGSPRTFRSVEATSARSIDHRQKHQQQQQKQRVSDSPLSTARSLHRRPPPSTTAASDSYSPLVSGRAGDDVRRLNDTLNGVLEALHGLKEENAKLSRSNQELKRDVFELRSSSSLRDDHRKPEPLGAFDTPTSIAQAEAGWPSRGPSPVEHHDMARSEDSMLPASSLASVCHSDDEKTGRSTTDEQPGFANMVTTLSEWWESSSEISVNKSPGSQHWSSLRVVTDGSYDFQEGSKECSSHSSPGPRCAESLGEAPFTHCGPPVSEAFSPSPRQIVRAVSWTGSEGEPSLATHSSRVLEPPPEDDSLSLSCCGSRQGFWSRQVSEVSPM